MGATSTTTSPSDILSSVILTKNVLVSCSLEIARVADGWNQKDMEEETYMFRYRPGLMRSRI